VDIQRKLMNNDLYYHYHHELCRTELNYLFLNPPEAVGLSGVQLWVYNIDITFNKRKPFSKEMLEKKKSVMQNSVNIHCFLQTL
jgi:hypothetical protein